MGELVCITVKEDLIELKPPTIGAAKIKELVYAAVPTVLKQNDLTILTPPKKTGCPSSPGATRSPFRQL